MRSQNESQTKSKSVCLLRKLLREVKEGSYPGKFAKENGITKQAAAYHFQRAEKKGYLKREARSSFLVYNLTPLGAAFLREVKQTSLPVRPSRVHNLVIKFPILKDNTEAQFDRKVEIKGWTKKYSNIEIPVGITLEKTTKSVLVYIHSFHSERSRFITEYTNTVNRAILFAYAYLQQEKGIVIDPFNGETIREHIANEQPEFNTAIDDKTRFEINLQRKAGGVYPKKEAGKAWIDRSEGDLEIETNDLLYQEKLLLVPEKVDRIEANLGPLIAQNTHMLGEFSEQLALHLDVLKDMKETLKAIRGSLQAPKKLDSLTEKANTELEKRA